MDSFNPRLNGFPLIKMKKKVIFSIKYFIVNPTQVLFNFLRRFYIFVPLIRSPYKSIKVTNFSKRSFNSRLLFSSSASSSSSRLNTGCPPDLYILTFFYHNIFRSKPEFWYRRRGDSCRRSSIRCAWYYLPWGTTSLAQICRRPKQLRTA